MNSQEYIQSGNLEAWCLGCLGVDETQELWVMCAAFPEVKQALHDAELSMEQLSATMAIEPADGLKAKVLSKLGFGLDLDNLPVINEDTDYQDFLAALAGLIPQNPAGDLWFHSLTDTPQLTQQLVYTRMNIPEETHCDLRESFFILHGTCKCIVGGLEYILNAGDFLEIPLHTGHDITMVTPHVVAILQQQMVA